MAYECEIEYTSVTGDIQGRGKVGGRGGGDPVPSCATCASLCYDTVGCRSYECSPTALKCRLNDAALPTTSTYIDYAFCVRKEFPVRAAGGQALVGDVPFTPEIKLDGTYYPVCGLHFGDNDEGASALCRLAGYTWGGKVIKTNQAYTKDAMPIGKCNPGEDIASCTAGGNAYGDLTHQEGMCTAGSPVGVQIACNEQVKDPDMWCIITNIFFCVRLNTVVFVMLMLHILTHAKCRMIDDYDSMLVCGPYLSNTTAYYQPNVEFDKQLAFLKGLFMAQLSPDCFSNLMSYACRSMFKECQKVAHDSALKSVMLPSLMVRAARVRSQTIISFDSH